MCETSDLRYILDNANRITAFTGAGISTDSGIPDFRSPGGIWTRYDPRDFTFERYVQSADVRAQSWQMRREFFAALGGPNAAHNSLSKLEGHGKSCNVITQNIDGLHQQAGSSKVLEIHGSARTVSCIGVAPSNGTPAGCGFVAPHTWIDEQCANGVTDPVCPSCGGLIKSATISFGQAMDPRTMLIADELCRQCDVMLAIGSSLQVFPAAGLPVTAKESGATLVIINDEETPLDDLADLVIQGRASSVLSHATDHLTANRSSVNGAMDEASDSDH